jgi:CRP-like cAMP-binding protein
MKTTSLMHRNHLLGSLSHNEFDRIHTHLKLVKMSVGDVLHDSGEIIKEVYYPADCIVSLLHVLSDGASAEIAVVGNDGIVGIPLVLGGETTTNRAVVRSAGSAYCLPGSLAKQEFGLEGQMKYSLLRYTQVLITQMAQTAACNRHHSIDQQLCRWLLVSLDRLDGNVLPVTQQLIADMLGVRREGVTDAAGKLQKLKIIEYSRGVLTVLDRKRLEALSCECYAVVRRETERLSPSHGGGLTHWDDIAIEPDVLRAQAWPALSGRGREYHPAKV